VVVSVGGFERDETQSVWSAVEAVKRGSLHGATNLTDLIPPLGRYLFDPTGPNARCVNRSDIDFFEEFPECAQITYNFTSIYMDDLQEQRIAQFRLTATTSRIAKPSCTSAAFYLFCMTTWRECMETEDGAMPVLAKSPCREVCEPWSRECVDGAVEGGGEIFRSFFSCDNPSPSAWGYSNYTLFPYPNDTTYDLSLTSSNSSLDAIVEIPCVGIYGEPPDIFIRCPDELKQEEDFCGMGCPLALISDPDYESLKTVISVCSWISVFCCLILSILWLSPFKRKYPTVLPLYFIICVGMSSFALTFGSFVGYKELLCKNGVEPNDFGNPACTIQGIMWVYFTLAGVMWWLVMAFNMVITLFPSTRKAMNKYGRYIYHIAWLLPIIPLIIGLASQRIGYGGDLWCTVHLTDPTVVFDKNSVEGINAVADKNVFYWKLGLIMLPIILSVFVGIILIMILIVFLIIKQEFTMKYFVNQWRLTIFVVFYIWIYVFLFIFWGVLRSNIDAQLTAYEDYLTCLFLENTSLAAADQCSLSRKVSFALWFIACLILSTQGLPVFLLFGTSPGLWRGWAQVLTGKTSFFSGSSSESKGKPTMTQVSVESVA